MKKKTVLIEHNIEIPARSKWEPVLADMAIGDSFACTITEYAAVRAKAFMMGMRVTSRTIEPSKVRVWRTK
jgi:hypothetical protein